MNRSIQLSIVLVAAISVAHASGEIYGTIETSDGEKLTGSIRWDQHENFWSDSLDGLKIEPSTTTSKKRGGFRFSLFGVSLGDLDETAGGGSQFGIPFGHLRSVVPTGSNRALLILKNGEEFEVIGFGGDLGRGLRNLSITDAERGTVELSWRDLDRVVFSGGPDGRGRELDRLYGTLTTVDDQAFSGLIVWDRDESFVDEILDGDDGDRDREIPFAEIRRIERVARGSQVTLTSGESLTLSGTNDVDDGHRGVAVSLVGVGTLEVDWDLFKSVEFKEPPPPRSYGEFDGGDRLRGTVHTKDGRQYSGEIVWDRDETFNFEELDGDSGDLGYAIPFANIRSITPAGGRCTVALNSGEKLELEGSNDVDYDNRGLIVKTPTSLDEIDWSEVAHVEFNGSVASSRSSAAAAR